MPEQSLASWEEGLEPTERARRAVQAAKIIGDLPYETTRRDYDLFNVRLYENNPNCMLYDYAGKYYAESSAATVPAHEQSKNNKAKAAIDTLLAQVTSTDQRARFLVVDGKSKQRRRAREMQNFSDGLAHELKLHALKRQAGRDAAVMESGKGFIQIYRDGDRVAAQRVLAPELSVDPRDGLVDGQPRVLYRRRPMTKPDVKKLVADLSKEDKARKELAIESAPKVASSGAPGEYIEVFEQWVLPTGKDTKDGWHIIAVDADGGDLVVEEHEDPFHDIVGFSWEDRFTTWWGLSLMSQVRHLQIRINANEYRQERMMKLFHSGHLYVNVAEQIKKSKLTNEIGTVWEGNGPNGPKQIMLQGASPEIEAKIDKDGALIFANLGINQSFSQGETDTGLSASAAAKREDKKRADERQAVRQQRWEQFHLDLMRVALAKVRKIVTGKGKSKTGYRVSLPDKRGLSVIDWKDVALDEEKYVIQVKAASPIPTEPAGLIAFGERMIEVGAWKPQQLAGYVQDLDADGRINRQMAQERQLERVFESLLYDPKGAAAPDEFTNLAMAIELGSEFLAQGEEDEVPEKNLEKVRRYLKRCKALMAKAAPPAPAAPMAQPAVDAGVPPLAAVA